MEGNQAQVGGGIYSDFSQLVLRDSSISFNNALGDGGGVFWRCQSPSDTMCNATAIVSTDFVSNEAIGGGGLYQGGPASIQPYWAELSPTGQGLLANSSVAANNTAEYGNLVAGLPVSLRVAKTGPIWSGDEVGKLRSNATSSTLQVSLQDEYQQTIKHTTSKGPVLMLGGDAASIECSSASIQLKNVEASVSPTTGAASFKDLIITASVDSTISLNFTFLRRGTATALTTEHVVRLEPCRP